MPEDRQTLLTRGLKLAAPRSLYFMIFAISGFSGLIYESIWSHYLKLFLGHAAYAQSLVLIIFMGGMAIGSWAASRVSARSSSPLLIYAGVELVVGIAALLFHDLFSALIETFYTSVLPSMGSPFAGTVLKWLAAGVLIMPQSILLGMTFPMMSAGIIRRFPDTPGGSIAMLYFTNSIGAALGVIASGFWLIKLVGLPGTIFSAGLLNIALALTVWIMVRLDPSPASRPLQIDAADKPQSSLKQWFLVAAFITGAASFIYEISWIRMLSLVLGATTHSFELMLSAFITGLAFGGLWIKRRIDGIQSPVRFSGFVQIIMGVLALCTIPVYVASFGWMEWLLSALGKTEAGYTSYSIASHVIALSVMLPTTFMAGMTLPLFTYVLIRKGYGEASIGQIYAANTIGAIVGVIFAVHIGLPFLGLKGLILIGAILDIALGIFLLSKSPVAVMRSRDLAGGALAGLGALVLTISAAQLDPRLLVSGVYRVGRADLAMTNKVLFYQDGKTASVSLQANPTGLVTLSTNGKPDAAIQFGDEEPYSYDELTMVVVGALPLAYHPQATRIANIGMGSGQTTHTLLANKDIEIIDTIEIESAMVAAARGYGEAVERAFKDPRSVIHIEDAKTFFSLHNRVYDIVVAEPSNPWVSGVSSLFSTEFYRAVKRYLDDDGLFVQWLQLYEFNDQLAESILKALAENFDDFVIYTTDGGNILIVAKKDGNLPEPDWSVLFTGAMARDLAAIDIFNENDMALRRLIKRDAFNPYLQESNAPVNSDYFPFVDLYAGEARYLESTSTMFAYWTDAPLPLLDMLAGNQPDYSALSRAPLLDRAKTVQNARWVYRRIAESATLEELGRSGEFLQRDQDALTDAIRQSLQTCSADENPRRWQFQVHDLLAGVLPYLPGEQGVALVDKLAAAPCETQSEPLTLALFDLYRTVARRDATSMASAGRSLLTGDTVAPRILQIYALAAAMLGDIAGGRQQAALRLWDQRSGHIFSDQAVPKYVELISRIAKHAEPGSRSR